MMLSTDIWVAALIRRVELAGSFATVARKGDARAGAVLVKTIDRRTGDTRLYSEAIRGEGGEVWMRPADFADEAAVDAYVDRAARIDPDVWVVEIEDADGARFLTEAVEGRAAGP
jgi:hypothetical protein